MPTYLNRFPDGDSGVDTNGTYGYAVLPNGFVQYPFSEDAPELMSGSYNPKNGNAFFHFFPNNPERGLGYPGGLGVWPDGTVVPNAYPTYSYTGNNILLGSPVRGRLDSLDIAYPAPDYVPAWKPAGKNYRPNTYMYQGVPGSEPIFVHPDFSPPLPPEPSLLQRIVNLATMGR